MWQCSDPKEGKTYAALAAPVLMLKPPPVFAPNSDMLAVEFSDAVEPVVLSFAIEMKGEAEVVFEVKAGVG